MNHINFKITEDEKEKIEAAAKYEHLSVSAFLRRLALKHYSKIDKSEASQQYEQTI